MNWLGHVLRGEECWFKIDIKEMRWREIRKYQMVDDIKISGKYETTKRNVQEDREAWQEGSAGHTFGQNVLDDLFILGIKKL